MATECNMVSEQPSFKESVENILSPAGFECYPFKIGWYNDVVNEAYSLDYPIDTLAFIIISTPAMFEKAFIPYICRQECTGAKDPIDECVSHYFDLVKQNFPDEEIDMIHDYEMNHRRQPKVLVQSAGHVSGAVRYYQKSDVKNQPWDPKKKIYGVAIHPKYGGWFALRGVMIFKSRRVPDLPKIEPEEILKTDEEKIQLLEKFNYSWQDWTFRDVIPVDAKYSEHQKSYFAALPKNRIELLEQLKQSSDSKKE